jgi:DUF1009 family protein
MSDRLGRMIAVVAGSGGLPGEVICQLEKLSLAYVVVSIKGFGPEQFESFELGEIGAILGYMKSHGVTDIIFCGSVRRPSLLSLRVDKVGRKWLGSLGVRAFLGDDSLLRGIKKLIEKEGMSVISPQSILNTLLSPEGVMTKKAPSQTDLRDIARGIFVLNSLSRADVGQSVVVQEGVVLGIEAIEGTDRLIRRCSDLKISRDGGVLVKTSKIGQDSSIDIPTIGPDTIAELKSTRLSGIAVGAGRSQIIDYEKTVSLADQSGIFIIGIDE